LDFVELAELYARNRNNPGIRLKRELWTKSLTTALGTQFQDEDALFVEHTLLVAMAEIIGHAVVGFNPSDPTVTPATILSGRLFAQAQISGVIEADFFDWPVDVAGGETFVRTLARRLSRFAWEHVEHDVMKVLYESVISAEQRHRLGEYYTPDWLAESIVEHVVMDPLHQRVLDPSCGSGTFLFHAVRRYLAAAAEADMSQPGALNGVTRAVTGLDVHPVAVTLARVTYLLAIGVERLQDPERPAFSVPVYLGDSMQWGQQNTLLNTEALTVPTDGGQLFGDELAFPRRLLNDAGRFDQLVAELADRAADRPRHSKPPSLTSLFRLFAVHPDDQPMVTNTFQIMCDLHDGERNHTWGYYVRNLARPLSLAGRDNGVDVLIGNPPWLAYRFMTPNMKIEFREMSQERAFWAGAAVATQQDLSALFVARCVELYLREDGRFAFVMPLAVLTRGQYAGFRSGKWSSAATNVNTALTEPWDLHRVKPSFFPVPACVIFGERTAPSRTSVVGTAILWSGRLPSRNASLVEARPLLRRDNADHAHTATISPYARRFSNGATLFPRLLVMVKDQLAGPLGAGAGRRAVRSRRSANEKKPWKELPDLVGSVEKQFVLPTHLGDKVLPFRTLDPSLAVVPWDGQRLLSGTDERIDLYPGLASWWRQAEQLWVSHRTSALTLLDQLDYRRKLSGQLPGGPHRVVYSGSGMYLAAALINDPRIIFGHGLYWTAAADRNEARYLTAIFNSNALLEFVRPLQSRGEHNPRHFDKYVFQVPIPLYDPDGPSHVRLAELAQHAEDVAAAVDLPIVSFQAQRRRIREALKLDGVATEIDEHVHFLLAANR
jgi:hypothetical protein